MPFLNPIESVCSRLRVAEDESAFSGVKHVLEPVHIRRKRPSEYKAQEAGAAKKAGKNPSSFVIRERIPEIDYLHPKVLRVRMRKLDPSMVRDFIHEHCDLIKTVDDDMIPGIERRIKRLYENGNTTEETIRRYLEDECGLEPWQAERIIRDQMNKYDTSARLESFRKAGVKFVRWRHGDSKDPREYHVRHWDGHSGLHNGHPNGLAGFVFPIDSPPVIDEKTGQRGWPGDLVLCSCRLEAVK